MTFRSVCLPAVMHHVLLQWCRALGFIGVLLTGVLLAGSLLSASFAHADTSIISDDGGQDAIQTTSQTAGQTASQFTGQSAGRSPGQSAGEEHAIINDLELTRRVLGGDDAEFGDWPSIVAIATAGFFPFQDRFFCGGTLVADRYVLTAAHCLFDVYGRQENASNLRIVAGIHDLSDSEDFVETDVTNVIIHPDYDNSLESPPNDIALLELSNGVDAPVGQLFAGESEDYTDTLGFILGWGATRYVNDNAAEYPTVLQEGRVPLVSLEVCNSPISYNGIVDVTQLCAGFSAGEVDTCAGDSGGPLYILNQGEPIQIGITSFGNGCAQPNFYGIYSNISHYIPWLANYISVPLQSDELVASRLAGETAAGSPKGVGEAAGSSGGALNPMVMLMLMMAAAFRLTACSAQSMEKPLVEKPDGQSLQLQLELQGDGQRAGVNTLRLGLARDAVIQALPASVWHPADCRTGKTALQGTGRLFMTEQCVVVAREPLMLSGLPVSQISYILIGQQLARFDLFLVTDSAAGNLPAPLMESLDALYPAGSTVNEWRYRQDEIRWLPEQGLQFLDGRFRHSLPALFDANPVFD